MVLKTNDNLKIDENDEGNNMKLEVDDFGDDDDVKKKDESNKVSIGQMLKFSDVDKMIDEHKREETVSAPKSVERLEIISNERNEARKMEELTNMDDDDEKLKISMEDVQLNFEDLGSPSVYNDDLVVLDDVELLV